MTKASIPWTTKQIVKMAENGSLTFENAVQRNLVWDVKRKSLLIDSILRNYPIPPFYTIRTDEKVETAKGSVTVYDCLDGKQRCNAIVAFKKNEYRLEGLETIVSEEGEIDLNGLSYETLPEDLRDTFDSYTLSVYSFTDATDEDVVEIMRRLNNGKPLSAIDLTRIKAVDLAGLTRLANHPFFANLSAKAIEGRHPEDIIVKFVALLNNNGVASLDNKDIKKYYEETVYTEELSKTIATTLDSAIEVVEHITPKYVKKFLSKTTLISMLYFLYANPSEGSGFVDAFFDSEELVAKFKEYNTNGSNHLGNVEGRFNVLNDALVEFSK